jgi:phosphoribosylformylglycinamidine (FGAM) synthase-like amidotransferase family enzyme
VVGIMPHPERAADPVLGLADGRGFFTSMAAWKQPSTAKVLSQ